MNARRRGQSAASGKLFNWTIVMTFPIMQDMSQADWQDWFRVENAFIVT